jgi:hypothetical protein
MNFEGHIFHLFHSAPGQDISSDTCTRVGSCLLAYMWLLYQMPSQMLLRPTEKSKDGKTSRTLCGLLPKPEGMLWACQGISCPCPRDGENSPLVFLPPQWSENTPTDMEPCSLGHYDPSHSSLGHKMGLNLPLSFIYTISQIALWNCFEFRFWENAMLYTCILKNLLKIWLM